MDPDQTAAAILDRLRNAQELMEEVEILAARDEDALMACGFETAKDICRSAAVIDRLATSVRWPMLCRSDRAYVGADLGRGAHENFVREQRALKGWLRRLEARARDAAAAGSERKAAWYLKSAEIVRAKLAQLVRPGPALPPAT